MTDGIPDRDLLIHFYYNEENVHILLEREIRVTNAACIQTLHESSSIWKFDPVQ